MILPCVKFKLKYRKKFILLKIRLAIEAAPKAATAGNAEEAGAKAQWRKARPAEPSFLSNAKNACWQGTAKKGERVNNKKLGEVKKETRVLNTHLNGNYPTETAVMEYRSDYLGRMQHIVYPDGEKVTYGYDKGGQVVSVKGEHWGHEFNYVTNILYDEYGQRTRIDYGNGTFTEYNYDPARRWLDTIKTENKWGQSYQNISYSFDTVGNVLGYENNCLDNVTGNYKTRQTYSYDNLYQLIKVEGETTYNPYRSTVPEFVSNYSQDFVFDELGLGNMTSKVSKESVSPLKKIGDNLNYRFDYIYDENFAHRLVRAGDRYYKYDLNGNIICEQDGSFESNGNDTAYHKIEQETDDVYSTDYGWGLFKEDKTGSTTSRYRRTYTWNERNQLVSSVDANYSTAYVYGQDGQRSNKYTGNSETLYFNKMWTHHTDSGNSIYGGQTSKNIYLGETRIVTKLNAGTDPTYQEEYYKQYYYHSDHLGSASMISDYKGDEYQRIEYTPYGETWVEKTKNTGLEYLPYKFTAKELDEETGLYYYGARYLDPKYSMWISCDPALGEYIPQAPVNDEIRKNNQNLPGMGGVFNTVNLNLYHYAANNPVKYTDPDGRSIGGKLLGYGCYLVAGIVLVGGAVVTTTGQVYLTAGAVKLSSMLLAAGTAVLTTDAINDAVKNSPKTTPSFSKGNSSSAAAVPSPLPPDPDDEENLDNKSTSQNQMQKQVERGKAPRQVDRVDKAHQPGTQDHVHFKDGTSLNKDGSIHDSHRGSPNLTNATKEWLKKNGWCSGE